MKKTLFILVLVLLSVGLLSCRMGMVGSDGSDDPAVSAADSGTAQVIDLVIAAKTGGDYTELEDFLAAEDPDGQLREVLSRHGVFQTARAAPRALGDPLPLFDAGTYGNGDVLLSKSSGTLTSDIMGQVLNRGWGHGGILYQNLATGPDAGCVLSANLEGLTFETYQEWAAADAVRVMHPPTAPGGDLRGVLTAHPFPLTMYAFIHLDFTPVARGDDYLWYCSKVPWRVYNALGPDIEDAGFYELASAGGRWTALRDSLLYDVYRLYLHLSLPWWRWWRIPALADARLRLVLGELITPDELRYSSVLTTGPFYGSGPDPDLDWSSP